MIRLCERTVEEGIEHHKRNPVRVYIEDECQKDRILRSQKLLAHSLACFPEQFRSILEVGCGAGDISGPFPNDHVVVGVDCHAASLKEAEKRYPNFNALEMPIDDLRGMPESYTVCLLCEILEHLEDPIGLVKDLLPRMHSCVISHPINEHMSSPLSGGDHCWSFSENDFKDWFVIGGHDLIEYSIFEMGSYNVALGRGIAQGKGMMLHNKRIKSNVFVHRLVLEAFVGPSDLQVNHKNLITTDNRLENLEYVTRAENMRHAVVNGHNHEGEKHGLSKLTNNSVLEIRKLCGSGISQKKIAAAFGVSQSLISSVNTRTTWDHI